MALQRNFQTISEGLSDLTILHWNSLADQLAMDFPSCPQEFLAWTHREPMIINELMQHNPDVICMEEIDKYESVFLPYFSQRGYVGIYKKKPGWHHDGSAVFYNT